MNSYIILHLVFMILKFFVVFTLHPLLNIIDISLTLRHVSVFFLVLNKVQRVMLLWIFKLEKFLYLGMLFSMNPLFASFIIKLIKLSYKKMMTSEELHMMMLIYRGRQKTELNKGKT